MKLDRARDYGLILAGALLQALAMNLFLVPGRLAAGGVSGLAIIVNTYTGWPIGVMIILGNIPLFLLGWRLLGGRRFMARTAAAVVVYSLLLDLSVFVLPRHGLTVDPVLNALYGGVIGGVGMGLVFRAGGTSGGTDILARLLVQWRHTRDRPKQPDDQFLATCRVKGPTPLSYRQQFVYEI